MEDEFEIMCGIGRDSFVEVKTTTKSRKPGIPVRKDLAKILGYNPKREEFDEEEKDEVCRRQNIYFNSSLIQVLCELNFTVPNYCNDTVNSDAATKIDSRKRNRKPRDKFNNLGLSDEHKLEAISYYNSVLDLRHKQYKLIREWGLLENNSNPMKNVIIETDDEREFVNTMKIFARFNSPKQHINLMNSLLLEKNLREFISYLKDAKKKGRHNLKELKRLESKQNFQDSDR